MKTVDLVIIGGGPAGMSAAVAAYDAGLRDILICGNKITRMAETIEGYDMLPDVDVYDARGMIVAPGLIDLHVHVTGGGGEQGPSSRVPEIALSELLLNGVTTCVGMLGTDGTSRSLENLLSKPLSMDEKVRRILALEAEEKNAEICDYTVKVSSFDAAAREILDGLFGKKKKH